jgi:hypothetical protein
MAEIVPAVFWEAFATESAHIREQLFTGELRPAYERVVHLLDQAGYTHAVELTVDDDDGCLIFTPESNAELARVVDDFVGAAPPVPGWKVFNRRQQKPWEDALTMAEDVWQVNASDARFVVEQADTGFNVTMLSDAAEFLAGAEAEGFVTFFLEHALGEQLCMERVRTRGLRSPDVNVKSMGPRALVKLVVDGEVPEEG